MQFDKNQIRMGTNIELEHTTSRRIARKIAKDHLLENPRYYTYLKRMEKQMDADLKKAKRKK